MPSPDGHAREVRAVRVRARVNAGSALLASAQHRGHAPANDSWRTVYEWLPRSPDLREYQSVAWVRTPDYWQDLPGRQSLRANFEAAHRGVLVERIVILRDDLWPEGQALPGAAVLPWVEEQHNHGLWVLVVHESEVAGEPDLPADFGVYGDRAVGVQEFDGRSRTLRFTLTFDAQAVRLAKGRWRRLALYATSFQSLLDRAPGGRVRSDRPSGRARP
jgi:hypothetical protein